MKKRALSYFFLSLLLFLLFNLPMHILSPLRSKLLYAKEEFAASDSLSEEARLRNENFLLKKELSEVKQVLFSEERIKKLFKQIEELSPIEGYKEYYTRRLAALAKLLQRALYSVEAKVIFRDISSWSSGVWVDKGSDINQALGFVVVAKNSPVVIGSALLGVVEKVERDRSYVRLITDSSLTPAVRVVRGKAQEEALLTEIEKLEELLSLLGKDPSNELRGIKEAFYKRGLSLYLAKGELHGSKTSLFRKKSYTLKGVGFNYEFSDSEGEGRGLHDKTKEPLVEKGDLLITSGLDGVFPQGLEVAFVKEISPLKEGAYAYDLEATPVIASFNNLSQVQILPPLTYTP